MAGNFDFLHIKRRTAGSSNELSLDVLDHKSAEADMKTGKAPRLAKPSKSPQGSYRGVSGATALSGQTEVAKRKKARRTRRIRLRVVMVAVLAVLIGVGAYAGLTFHELQVDYRARTLALVDRLADADETMVEIDDLMEDPLGSVSSSDWSRVLADMPDVKTRLNRIAVDAESLLEYPVGEREQVVVGQISKAAQARIDMTSAAAEAHGLSVQATEQVEYANRVWNAVLNADQAAREAVAIANKAETEAETDKALAMTREADEGFSDALAQLRDLHFSYGVDFTDQESYLDKRIEALKREEETGEALLAGNRDEARRANEAYNEADAEAAELARDLPPFIGSIVQERFKVLMVEHQMRYVEARNRAVAADSVIREYIG